MGQWIVGRGKWEGFRNGVRAEAKGALDAARFWQSEKGAALAASLALAGVGGLAAVPMLVSAIPAAGAFALAAGELACLFAAKRCFGEKLGSSARLGAALEAKKAADVASIAAEALDKARSGPGCAFKPSVGVVYLDVSAPDMETFNALSRLMGKLGAKRVELAMAPASGAAPSKAGAQFRRAS